jgi:uncharacterized protein YjbI with pentapeptide repeats
VPAPVFQSGTGERTEPRPEASASSNRIGCRLSAIRGPRYNGGDGDWLMANRAKRAVWGLAAILVVVALWGNYPHQADLTGIEFKPGINLAGRKLTHAEISYENLTGANLRGVDLSHAHLQEVKLKRANLARASLRRAWLESVDLTGANLTSTDLRDAALSGTRFDGANLRGANLGSADMEAVFLPNADLRGATLSGSDMNSARLTGADLRGADLRRTTDLGTGDLTGARYNAQTRWPQGFNPVKAGAVLAR